MRRGVRRVVMALALLLVGAAVPPVTLAAPKILSNTDLLPLASVPGPVIGGVQPGGRPWSIERGSKARLDADGEVKVIIHGLVFTDTGTARPLELIKAGVVCGGTLVGTTGTVPISADGDAEVRDTVTLPSVCDHPIVLVLTPNDRWIATTRLP